MSDFYLLPDPEEEDLEVELELELELRLELAPALELRLVLELLLLSRTLLFAPEEEDLLMLASLFSGDLFPALLAGVVVAGVRLLSG
ncbi:hypothetical protein FACS1894145_1280 [Bacteroidia bacterium]|nr:hypothetical protein FACS1894145_1280 [Bacteroidia bacterium]